MSKHNKANKSNYIQAGRLTPDEMARERERQRRVQETPPPARNGAPKGITERGSRPDGKRKQ
jgi:hypothetical protein